MFTKLKIKTKIAEVGAWKKIKKVFASSFLVLALGLMLIPANTSKVKGDTPVVPRFNFLVNDSEMLKVAKTTDPTWTDPVSANVGDRVSFLFYYHNGMLNSVAHSTKVRVDLPINMSNKLVATSYLWSQETAAISDTIVNGQVVGLSGGTINLPTSARIEYVAGSTNWFPNGTQTPTHMPDGIVSNSGLDLGDIQGCWNFAGYVSFMADIKAPAQMVMDKTVAYPGETIWHDEIMANPGDEIAYHLGVRNDGGTIATNLNVRDLLPTYMTYVPSTTYIYTKDHPEGIKKADTLFAGGIALPDMAPGQDNVIYITYKTKITMNMPVGAYALNNVAKVYMGGVEQDQDQAKVTVTSARGLTLDKKVSNGVSWVEENNAVFGDTITYRIVVTNTGNTPLANAYVRDALPVYLQYIMGSTRLEGAVAPDSIVTAQGLFVGSINAGASKTITLSGKITGCTPLGNTKIINTAYGRADGVVELSDPASTIVRTNVPVAPGV